MFFKQLFGDDAECIFPNFGGDLVQLALRRRVDAIRQQFLGPFAPVSRFTERDNGIEPETKGLLLSIITISQNATLLCHWASRTETARRH